MGHAYYNPNPAGKSVGDCPVRAIAKATGKSWEEVYTGLCLEGFRLGDMPNADSVWGPYLRRQGFHRHLLSDDCPDCYTVEDFARDNPCGTFIVSMPGRHVLCVQDGHWHDSWNSGGEVPTYYWEKER